MHPKRSARDEHECDKTMNYDWMSLISSAVSVSLCGSAGRWQVEGKMQLCGRKRRERERKEERGNSFVAAQIAGFSSGIRKEKGEK